MSSQFTSTDRAWSLGGDSRVHVLDSQIGWDLDELIALWVAARTIERLVVVTSDETRCRRAGLARLVLDLLGREEVPVVAGCGLDGAEERFLFDDYRLPSVASEQPDAARLIASHAEAGPVTVVGLGALTNIAELFFLYPHVSENVDLVVQGGWLDHYRKPGRASHNLFLDQSSAGVALRMARTPRLVMSTHTNDDRLRLRPDSPLVAWFRATDSGFARLAAAYCDRWLAIRPDGSWQADSVAVAVAVGAPVADFVPEAVRVAADARLYRDPRGPVVSVTTAVHDDAFADFMHQVIPEAPLRVSSTGEPGAVTL